MWNDENFYDFNYSGDFDYLFDINNSMNNISISNNDFNDGKIKYKNSHKVHKDQETRHIVARTSLNTAGVNKDTYKSSQSAKPTNYRMGSKQENSNDKLVDNQLDTFMENGIYNSEMRLSKQNQLDRLGQKFDVCKEEYERTGDMGYYRILESIRTIAQDDLNGDMRQFRIPK